MVEYIKNNNLLRLAQDQNNPDRIKSAIQEGAKINAQDEEGNTVLHYAVTLKNKEVVEFLVAVGANPNIKNLDNKTALKITQKRNDHKMLKILLPSVTHKVKFYPKRKTLTLKNK